jgi:hypothetical protein
LLAVRQEEEKPADTALGVRGLKCACDSDASDKVTMHVPQQSRKSEATLLKMNQRLLLA